MKRDFPVTVDLIDAALTDIQESLKIPERVTFEYSSGTLPNCLVKAHYTDDQGNPTENEIPLAVAMQTVIARVVALSFEDSTKMLDFYGLLTAYFVNWDIKKIGVIATFNNQILQATFFGIITTETNIFQRKLSSDSITALCKKAPQGLLRSEDTPYGYTFDFNAIVLEFARFITWCILTAHHTENVLDD